MSADTQLFNSSFLSDVPTVKCLVRGNHCAREPSAVQRVKNLCCASANEKGAKLIARSEKHFVCARASCCRLFRWIIKGSETILSDFIIRSLFVPLQTNFVGQLRCETPSTLDKRNRFFVKKFFHSCERENLTLIREDGE